MAIISKILYISSIILHNDSTGTEHVEWKNLFTIQSFTISQNLLKKYLDVDDFI